MGDQGLCSTASVHTFPYGGQAYFEIQNVVKFYVHILSSHAGSHIAHHHWLQHSYIV